MDLKLPRLNRVLISGRIANDLELRYTAKGTPVVRFTLAVDKAIKDESGQWQNQASFIEVAVWKDLAEKVNKEAHKGSPLIVEGSIETRNYVDQNGNNRKSVEVIASYIQFLEYQKKDDSQSTPQEQETPPSQPVNNDSDVPF